MTSLENIERSSLRLSRIGRGFVGLSIGVAFTVLALRGVDLFQVKANLWDIDIGMLPAVLIIVTAIFLLKAFRWRYLMSPLKHIAFWQSFRAIVVGFMANNAVPLRGGDLVQAHLLGRREAIRTATVFATVALDRIFETLSLLTFCLLVLLTVPLPGWIRSSVIILGVALLGGTAGIIAVRHPPKLLKKWWGACVSLLPFKLQEIVSVFIKQVRLGLDVGKGKVRLTNLYFLAVVESVFWGFLVYCSLKALGVQLSAVAIMSIIVATNLAVMVPLAPANIGVFEFAVMTILELFELDKTIAFSGAVILHAIQVIPISLLGLVFVMREWLVPKGAPLQ